MIFRIFDRTLRAGGAATRRLGLWLTTRRYRAALAACGDGTRFQAGVAFRGPDQISWGQAGYVWAGVSASAEHPGGQLDVGDGVQINRDVHLDYTGGLRICDDVLISEQVVIYTHDHGRDPRRLPALCPKVIGAGVWIGMRAVILPGCRRIGAGAIIGAGAVVTRDVPTGVTVAGNPARVIGQPQMTEVAA